MSTEEKIEKLLEVSQKYGDGDILTYSEIESILGSKRYSGQYNTQIRWFKDLLLKRRQLFTLNKNKVGYFLYH